MSVYAGNAEYLHDFFYSNKDFVIPDYQREYSWETDNVKQLFDDLNVGLSRLEKSESYQNRKDLQSRFLGCVIQWDRDARADFDYHPVPGVNYLSRVSEIIDGQQRISTITLILAQVFFKLDEKRTLLDESIDEEKVFNDYLLNEIQYKLLPYCFARKGKTGSTPQLRPSLIRLGEERWTHNTPVTYNSPVTSYLHKVIEAIEHANQTGTLIRPESENSKIKEIIGCIDDQLEIIPNMIHGVLDEHYTQDELFGTLGFGPNAIDLEAYFDNNPDRKESIEPLVNLVALIHYLLNYTVFTVISSPDQNAALDMFQSLNATGLQLTAVQILKPYLAREYREKGGVFADSEEFELYSSVNEWLNEGRNKDTKTKEFFFKLGLIINGKTVSSTLSGQRSWLVKTYQDFVKGDTGLDKTKLFVSYLYYLKEYLDKFYFTSRDKLFEKSSSGTGSIRYHNLSLIHDSKSFNATHGFQNDAAIAFMFIHDAKHEISHALLARFYIKYQLTNNPGDAGNCSSEFFDVCRACAAFYALFRYSLKSMYPDGAYRELFSSELSLEKNEVLNKAVVLKALREKLKENVREQMQKKSLSWVELMMDNVAYKQGYNALVRFFIIISCNKTVPNLFPVEAKDYALLKFDSTGPAFLSPDVWLDEHFQSIEHIAPQKLIGNPLKIDYWDDNLRQASDIVNSVGNLTLLSSPLNASTPETSNDKLRHYLGLVQPGAPVGVTAIATALIAKAPSHGHLLSAVFRLGRWQEDINNSVSPDTSDYQWNIEFINKRTRNLSLIVRKQLYKWLF